MLVPLLRNRFKVLGVLGQGGFGRTYLAQDLDNLQMRCVVKQLVHPSTNPRTIEKVTQLFGQEARQLQSLGPEHPQIPTLIAYFQEEDYLYLVQQFIKGPTLSQELEKHGPFPEPKIRTLLRELLPVLAFIHGKGIIHRDIKPDNIIRCEETGRLVLIDFGICQSLQLGFKGQATTIVGSFGYAPRTNASRYGLPCQ
jgi:serine/threonine protein kinase